MLKFKIKLVPKLAVFLVQWIVRGKNDLLMCLRRVRLANASFFAGEDYKTFINMCLIQLHCVSYADYQHLSHDLEFLSGYQPLKTMNIHQYAHQKSRQVQLILQSWQSLAINIMNLHYCDLKILSGLKVDYCMKMYEYDLKNPVRNPIQLSTWHIILATSCQVS